MAQQDYGSSRRVIIGKINGIYGVNGGLKVFSYTQPREQIFSYQPWVLKLSDSLVCRDIVTWQGKGKGLVVFLEGITDPEQARNLLGVEITVNREQLPSLPGGEFYWCDLIHLELVDTQGNSLGLIVDMQDTGANDVMVVRQGDRQLLVPWVMHKVVTQVDLETGRVYVDWNPEYQ